MPNDPKSAAGMASTEDQGINGEIVFQSDLASGTATSCASGAASPAAGAPLESAKTFNRLNILLVDDVEANQRIGRAVLEAAGHYVETAWNGAEAVKAVQARRYDLVLMDVQMPTMDGLEATRCIRALDHPAASVPIIALTSNTTRENLGAALASGMIGYLGKPYAAQALLDVVHQVGSRA